MARSRRSGAWMGPGCVNPLIAGATQRWRLRLCLHREDIMRAISIFIAAVMIVGCATNHTESTGTGEQGLAELHVDAHSLIAANVTRVIVDAGNGITQDLTL